MLLRGEADYQLHLIYLWYERQPNTALKLIEGLRSRYFAQSRVLHPACAGAGGLPPQSIGRARNLSDAPRRCPCGTRRCPGLSEVYARLGMAQEMDATCETAAAIDHLRAVIAAASRRHHIQRWRARIISSARRSIAAAVDRKRSHAYQARARINPAGRSAAHSRESACSDQTRTSGASVPVTRRPSPKFFTIQSFFC